MPYVTERWLGGMLTNHSTIRKSVAKLKHLQKLQEEGYVIRRSKKEIMRMQI